MKRQMVLAGALLLTAAATHAQVAPYRRFTEPPTEVRGYEHKKEVPLGWKTPGGKLGEVPPSVTVATWNPQALGSVGVKPERVMDRAKYVLERLSLTGSGSERRLVAVVVRQTPLPEGAPMPELHFVDAVTALSVQATGTRGKAADGVRFTFEALPPMLALAPPEQRAQQRISDRYELRLAVPAVLTARK